MDARHIYTVTEFTSQLKRLLGNNFPLISVEGEVSEISVSGRGHTYFSIQDKGALLSCILWSSKRGTYGRYLRQGDKVIVTGRIDVYERGGRYSLIAQRIEPSGLGRLLVQLQQLRMKLAAEGLFDTSRKRRLPLLPKKIGVVTAINGAAVRDIIKTLRNRLPVNIVIAPASVQGDNAPREIIAGIRALSRIPDLDVIIIGRGGGSFEDLFCFNDEALVRAVAQCPKPVISAVGHERDEVLTDLAADVRAATPTAAGQIAVPDRNEMTDRLNNLAKHLTTGLARRLTGAEMALDASITGLSMAIRVKLDSSTQNMHQVAIKLSHVNPSERVKGWKRSVEELEQRLFRAGQNMLKYRQAELERIRAEFDAKDPYGPLKRGYALLKKQDGNLVRSSDDVRTDERLTGILKQGQLCLRVEEHGKCETSGHSTG